MSRFKKFKPAEGFGGNPVEKESWWRLTENMAIRAAKYGMFNDIEKYAKENGLYNFSMDLVDGSDTRKLEGTQFYAEMAKKSEPLQKEIALAKVLIENNHSVYFIPQNRTSNVKNPDAIVDGKVADFKILASNKIQKVVDNIKKCDEQKVQLACIQIPESIDATAAIKEAKNILNLKYVREIWIVKNKKITKIKK